MLKQFSLSDIHLLSIQSESDRIKKIDITLDYIKKYSPEIQKIYFISSTELMFLQHEIVSSLITYTRATFTDISISIISLGCVGFYAALLNFFHSHHKNALICILEIPSKELQNLLNCIGIGLLPGQDGLISREGIGLCRLLRNKQPTYRSLQVRATKIIILENKVSATLSLLNHFVQTLQQLCQGTQSKIVSFNIHTRWSESLMRGLSCFKDFDQNMKQWLESSEQDHYHLHALKPLYELDRYSEESKNHHLIIPCLGAAGRIGFLQVGPMEHQELHFEKYNNCIVQNFESLPVIERVPALLKQVNYQDMNTTNVKDFLYFMQRSQVTQNNFYYEWLL